MVMSCSDFSEVRTYVPSFIMCIILFQHVDHGKPFLEMLGRRLKCLPPT